MVGARAHLDHQARIAGSISGRSGGRVRAGRSYTIQLKLAHRFKGTRRNKQAVNGSLFGARRWLGGVAAQRVLGDARAEGKLLRLAWPQKLAL